MKTIPNYISAMRILLSIALVFVTPLSMAFIIIYILCGLSDIIDGYIARKTNSTSRLGEKLDTAADLVLTVILAVVLFPFIKLTIPIIVWILVIAAIRVVSLIIVFAKYKTFQILHTYGNKITGLILLTLPLSLAFFRSDNLLYLICAIANISAVEELLINISSVELQANRKSIFSK